MTIRFAFFDCMETIVQLEVPSFDLYADWCWEGGAGGLGLWPDLEGFRAEWKRSRDRLGSLDGGLREGTILGRIRDAIASAAAGRDWSPERVDGEARGVHESFWRTYRAETFVLPEAPAALDGM